MSSAAPLIVRPAKHSPAHVCVCPSTSEDLSLMHITYRVHITLQYYTHT